MYEVRNEPNWIRPWDSTSSENSYYGVISGISPDKIAYATQASEAAFIVNEKSSDHAFEIRCEILAANFRHSDDKLYMSFNSQNMRYLRERLSIVSGDTKPVMVEFEVNHTFFNNLIDAINSISSHTVSRIVPACNNFLPLRAISPEESNLAGVLVPDSEDEHIEILKQVIRSPASSPPVLIKGAFGTGKTRLLALIARFYVVLGRKRANNIRVLMVAHHQATADILLENYCKLLPKIYGVIRMTSSRYKLSRKCKLPQALFKKCYDVRNVCSMNKHNSIEVIISTFQTALHLKNILTRSRLGHMVPNFFTHILIDEGAQGWEPEAVAPLCFASEQTKIVIVGDPFQVTRVYCGTCLCEIFLLYRLDLHCLFLGMSPERMA